MQRLFPLCVFFGLCASWILAQDGSQQLSSGPQVGKVLPGTFDSLVLNGKKKGRQHCLVCAQGLNPAVLVFAREPGEGKDGPLTTLLAKLDEALDLYQDTPLGASVVFLSADAKNSANNEKEQDPDKLVEEAKARDDLVKRLTTRSEKLKGVVVGCFPQAGPKAYEVSPKAEVTVLVYDRHKVLANFSFAEGKMTQADVARVMAKVDEMMKARAEKN